MSLSKLTLSFVVGLSLFSQASFAAPSKRVLTCKGHSNEKYFENFRVNILKVSENEYKATLSGGFTTQNTSETWKVTVANEKGKITVEGLNKTPFKLVVLKNEKASVDDIYGMEAKAEITYIAKPYMAPAETLRISGQMACSEK